MSSDLETKFWKSLENDLTVFLACDGALPRPMAASVDGHNAPIWFFTSHDTDIGKALKSGPKSGIMTFSSKGNDIWASASGELVIDNDKAMIDKLWNPFVAAWYEDGKDDPKLCLVRYDAKDAQIWENGSSIVAGLKALMGQDPKKDYEDKTAHVRLDA
ncbi:pyridoxamine 5'-phosphate oxidase family protein [Jannaschia donghaensis]|uniref:Putative stress protein (General stress protein 26) n=1 Tax=Jannaschia donghaensis TaxID=420998 RepID=A0A0M6YF49_9RHOB|nr:pyridoxamine 5'-phosphate oxidase family protein [Jannaschia donghaensis]CTQ48305.1 putative stress protein (general stress protein 26) [Jannaschia donghaensis]